MPLLGLASEASSQKFLQRAATTTGPWSTKTLSTPGELIDQLIFSPTDAVFCQQSEAYTVARGVYGTIRGPIGAGEEFLYPSDKAVNWLAGNGFLEDMFNQENECCNTGTEPDEAMRQCMIGVATAVEITQTPGQYEIAAVDVAKAGVTPIQPIWTNTKFHEALVQSYAWVFNDVKLTVPVEELQKSCQPNAATWKALEHFNQGSGGPGLEAYSAIMQDNTYGVGEGGQMHQLECEPTLNMTTGVGGCSCQGCLADGPCSETDAAYCRADTDVKLFCGSGGVESCDPRPFLCPRGLLPVGYVRAYLHKFFDAIPFFKGTGFSDDDGEVPEYIVSPNMKADSPGVKRTSPQTLF